MGQAREKSRAVLIVEDDAEVRSLAATLLEDKQLNVIECESAEAALAIMLISGRDVAMRNSRAPRDCIGLETMFLRHSRMSGQHRGAGDG
jgi:DNA-binding NtrC family response regulator